MDKYCADLYEQGEVKHWYDGFIFGKQTTESFEKKVAKISR